MKFSKKKGRRMDNSINAGSMADIAFLLLIFFLVTTQILEDKGILVKLPPYAEVPPVNPPSKNVLAVKVNAANELLVEGERATVASLRETTREFVLNPSKRDDLPSKPTKAVVSLQNDKGTNYQTYIAVYNELKAAYNEIWDMQAMGRYNQPYESLSSAAQRGIRKEIPLLISESEPTDYATPQATER
ncbi:MAG: biopolymer transporter ExbD [Bacteroidota bacterium]